MKENELQFDRTCHVLYSKPCKKQIKSRIALHYPEAERETIWECDYTLCGDKDPYGQEHPEYRDEQGYRRNRD